MHKQSDDGAKPKKIEYFNRRDKGVIAILVMVVMVWRTFAKFGKKKPKKGNGKK